MQVSGKVKTFLQFFVPFLECTSNFKHFGTRDDGLSQCFSEITVCEKLGHTTL